MQPYFGVIGDVENFSMGGAVGEFGENADGEGKRKRRCQRFNERLIARCCRIRLKAILPCAS